MRVLSFVNDRYRQLFRQYKGTIYSGRVLGAVHATDLADTHMLLAVEWKPNEVSKGRSNPRLKFIDFHSFDELLALSKEDTGAIYSAALRKGLI